MIYIKRFITRKKYNIKYFKIIFILIIVLLISFLLRKFKNIFKVNISYNLLSNSLNYSNSLDFLDIINFNLNKTSKIIDNAFSNKEDINKEPILYIYNTHQSEEYISNSLANYNITPTVYMASNILKKELEKYKIYSIVEDENIKNVLNEHKWSYKDSYQASRLWLNKINDKYPTIKYYLDLHRDSVSLTTNINNKTYARIMYVLGMNYEGYEKNEELINKLNDYTNLKYPGLSRDILYAKKNIFNQDFNSNVFLIEVGGNNSNFTEIYNSIIALAEVIGNVLGSE